MAVQQSLGESSTHSFDRFRTAVQPVLDRIRGLQGLRKSARNVQYHYDLSNDFFSKFLGSTWQYSCAYFESGTEDLDSAQEAKMRHIAAKLDLQEAQNILDIGCGWGTLLDFVGSRYGIEGKGITLSREQLRFARENMNSGDIRFEFEDYRDVEGPFSRIVSVGMLEHVGRDHYGVFFRRVRDLLTNDGLALIHTIGRRGPPAPINTWIRRKIFPGAYLPSLSQLASAVEESGLWLADMENLSLHYAETLRQWQIALARHEDEIRAERGDEFYRAWETYLVLCEMGFRFSGLTVFQLLLKKRIGKTPFNRRYMFEEEERLKRTTASNDNHSGIRQAG
jgi:cyclopropane-fatty-acyl-phospholipid synthase